MQKSIRKIWLYVVLLLCSLAGGLAQAELTNPQISTLKSAIAAETDPEFVALRTGGATYAMAEWLNGAYAPATLAWKTVCSAKDIDEGSDYSAYDSVVAGKRDAWSLFLQFAPRDMTRTKSRKVVTDVWGNATASSVAESVLLACTRSITRSEAVLGGSSTANTGTVSARKLTWEGRVTEYDVIRALQ